MGFSAKIRDFMGYPEDDYEDPGEQSEAASPEEEVEGPCHEVVLAQPEKFDDAIGIADHITANRIVVLNLESVPRETARRLIDFLGGAAYAKNGLLTRVAGNVYLITPYNVDYSDLDFGGVNGIPVF